MIKINIEVDKAEELVQLLDSLHTDKRVREAFSIKDKMADINRLTNKIQEYRQEVMSAEGDADKLKDIVNHIFTETLTEEQKISELEYIKENMKVVPGFIIGMKRDLEIADHICTGEAPF